MNKSALRRVLSYLRPRIPLILLSLFLNLLTVALTLLIPILVGRAIDCAVGPGQVDFTRLAYLLLKIGLCVSVSALLQWLTGALNNRLTFRAVEDIRRDAFGNIQRLPLKSPGMAAAPISLMMTGFAASSGREATD